MPNVSVDDINIYYEIFGKGTPLLMIMGLKFSLLDWGEKLPQKLAEKYQVILFDNRDAGRSSRVTNLYSIADMANDTAGLLAELEIAKAHVFGISMGGAIAQHFALNHANKVDKLILGCTMAGGNCSVYDDSIRELAFFSNQSPQDEDEKLWRLLFTKEFIDNNRSDLEISTQKTKQYYSEPDAIARQLNALFTHNTCNHLQDITASTLVITGDKDIAIPSGNSEFLAKGISRAKLEKIQGAAHAFCHSHPDETAKFILDFLQYTY